ncbi:TetR/AcrR family transcriptional regulator [Xylanibacillus composti]|uniref:TetR family transcriptional regulator n=1 Tax=Xylanibacillus composti TaxID=1572762 RepID=A0A8J4M1V9_9BACL|nr:TetR/AcrR family transcriptional regulator [Xylanibacillus composti]MDT9724856.1 TetR/AcrR family transcriptional regulator [Xylanibacillus composti]GIQ69049.1 TetR family transcriptional regulator [Xylanibacillus composti]
MARYKEEQAKQIREERKDQILNAALTVFAEYGIEGTKMNMIAKAAGLSHGLMYHYFKSKEEVLITSLQWAMNGAEVFIEEVRSSKDSPLGKIAHFTRSALTADNHVIFRVIQSCINHSNLDEATQRLIEHTTAEYVRLLVPILIEGQERGEVIDEDPDKLANLYLTILSGLIADDVGWLQQDLDWNIRMLLRVIQK